MAKQTNKKIRLAKRHGRVRAKVKGSEDRPRLSVFRSNTGLFLQIVNDVTGKTLVSANVKEIKAKDKKTVVSFELGKILAAKALGAGIKKVVFDRGGYKYHGRIKAVAEGARAGGLEF